MLEWLRKRFTVKVIEVALESRRVRMYEDVPSDRFVLLVGLMVAFFVGLIALEVANMVVFRQWSETVFNGIMLIVGTIVGAIWGKTET